MNNESIIEMRRDNTTGNLIVTAYEAEGEGEQIFNGSYEDYIIALKR